MDWTGDWSPCDRLTAVEKKALLSITKAINEEGHTLLPKHRTYCMYRLFQTMDDAFIMCVYVLFHNFKYKLGDTKKIWKAQSTVQYARTQCSAQTNYSSTEKSLRVTLHQFLAPPHLSLQSFAL